jgi:hypothetical protein
MMAAHECRIEVFEEPVNTSSIATSLTALGDDGWRVVSVVNDVSTHTRRSHAGPGGTGPKLLVFMEREL